jgi:hypothetical protein
MDLAESAPPPNHREGADLKTASGIPQPLDAYTGEISVSSRRPASTVQYAAGVQD